MAAPVDTSYRSEIRKLRKKLRQIEKLEHLDRDLTDEEYLKISKKDELRELLLETLTQESDYSGISNHSGISGISSSSVSDSYNHGQFEPSTEIIQEEHEPDLDQSSETIQNTSYTRAIDDYISYTSQGQGDVIDDVIDERDVIVERATEPVATERNEVPRRTESPEVETRRDESPAPIDPPKKAKKEEKKKASKKEPPKPVYPWRDLPYRVRELEGHNDIILCTHVLDELLATGSRDTMVKVWRLGTGEELRSFGGHTGAVTCLIILSQQQTKQYAAELELKEGERLVVSGSSDCSIKLWSIRTGHLVKSIYTYNPVSCLAYLAPHQAPNLAPHLVSTSGGGKLELWDVVSGEAVTSLVAHDDAITSLQVHDGGQIVLGTCDGQIKIYERKEDGLHAIYVSESMTCQQGHLFPSTVRCVCPLGEDTVLFGDEGVNIKLLNWRKGTVRKVRNHGLEFGVTDCIHVCGETVIASGYDLDSGRGYINVFTRPGLEYQCTLTSEDTGRILTMACPRPDTLVTGGLQLTVWNRAELRSPDTVQTVHLPTMSAPASDTDVESDEDDVTDDDDVVGVPRINAHLLGTQQGWTSWCGIL